MSLSKKKQEMFDELFPNINWLPSPSAKMEELGVPDSVVSQILQSLKAEEISKAQTRKSQADARLQRLQAADTE